MNRFAKFKNLLVFAIASLALHANSGLACAMCYGQSDSPLAKAMNWGIFALLLVVVGVLSGVASFAVFLAKKSASIPTIMPPGESLPANHKA